MCNRIRRELSIGQQMEKIHIKTKLSLLLLAYAHFVTLNVSTLRLDHSKNSKQKQKAHLNCHSQLDETDVVCTKRHIYFFFQWKVKLYAAYVARMQATRIRCFKCAFFFLDKLAISPLVYILDEISKSTHQILLKKLFLFKWFSEHIFTEDCTKNSFYNIL